MIVRAMLFDLDGVLVDSIKGVELAWCDWAAKHSLDANDVIAVVHGRRAADTVASVAPHLNLADEIAWLSQRESTDARGLHRVPGAAVLVAALPSAGWAVVTSGTAAVAQFRLAVGAIPRPSVLVTAEDVSRGKPDPEGYLRAAQLLGVTPAECVVVEDAPAGLAAAKAAGMQSIGIASTFDAAQLQGATIVVPTIADVIVHVDQSTAMMSVSVRTATHLR